MAQLEITANPTIIPTWCFIIILKMPQKKLKQMYPEVTSEDFFYSELYYIIVLSLILLCGTESWIISVLVLEMEWELWVSSEFTWIVVCFHCLYIILFLAVFFFVQSEQKHDWLQRM